MCVACRRRSVPLRRSPSVFFVRPIVISRTLSKIHPYGTLYKLAPLILLPRSDPSNSGEVFWFQILKNRSDININVKNCCFITMCKAHSKVTHIKQQKYFHHLKRPGYNTEFLLYPRPFRWWKYFRCFICVTLLWALHIVIKRQFFTFIFAVFLLNLLYTYSFS